MASWLFNRRTSFLRTSTRSPTSGFAPLVQRLLGVQSEVSPLPRAGGAQLPRHSLLPDQLGQRVQPVAARSRGRASLSATGWTAGALLHFDQNFVRIVFPLQPTMVWKLNKSACDLLIFVQQLLSVLDQNNPQCFFVRLCCMQWMTCAELNFWIVGTIKHMLFNNQ